MWTFSLQNVLQYGFLWHINKKKSSFGYGIQINTLQFCGLLVIMRSMSSFETDLCHGFARNWTSTDTLDEGYSSSTNICLPFAATVEKMVILAKSLHCTATVVNGGKKS